MSRLLISPRVPAADLPCATALSQLCRRTESGPVYLNPVTIPLQFWVLFITNQALNISWLFVWDHELMTAAAVFLFLIVITNWLAMYTLHVR